MRTRMCSAVLASVLVALVAGIGPARAQQAAPDLILSNGKIITVDDRFSIAQAVAVRGERIVAVGTTNEIVRLAGANTRRIDLGGKAVVPGLIDNHVHIMQNARVWQEELRLDGVESRAAALDMVRAKARTLAPGAWVRAIGGWSLDQFTDDRKPFTREELDRVAPNNPVLLAYVRQYTYLNSRAIEAIGLAKMNERWIVRDASGRPTGVIDEEGGFGSRVARAIPEPPKETYEASSFALMADMNRAGLTTVLSSCPSDDIPAFQQWARQGRLTLRFFCFLSVNTGTTPEQVEKALPLIAQLKPFQGDNWLDSVVYGEGLFGRLQDNWLLPAANPTPAQLALWRRIATELAKAGVPIQIHAQLDATIPAFLDQIEAINKEYPIRNLRWALGHIDQVTPAQLERMKNLGMYAAVHSRPIVLGQIWKRIHGERFLDMPPLKMIQDSGIQWGLGTDTFQVNQYRPFTTLWWAVTGKMLGGVVVNRQPISREDALIAHTRKNAYLVFQENNLGSIQRGKLADMVVLDRDYLTIPADQIKDIKPVLTMVGGKIVYDAAAPTSTR